MSLAVRRFHREARDGRPSVTSKPAISFGIPACFSGARTCCWINCASTCRVRRRYRLSAPVRLAGIRRATGVGLSTLRQHLHRLRRAGKGRRGARHCGRRFRVERRGKLECRLRAFGTRPQGKPPSPSNRLFSIRITTLWTHAARLVALIGVRDLIVVDTPDALLVAARDRAQQVGDIVKTLEQRDRHDRCNPK